MDGYVTGRHRKAVSKAVIFKGGPSQYFTL
jgi:hypothetical protein